ncbi:hypothetical protein [Saccharibacillus endophyticus]|uniref:Uncharacterized protein n=1 Tax=Saccharibacillus endophyticus TaxID=2060666 RepID=A0ABQ1ZWT4_9BACL|nr:hypothetical protein [Saccharibacillus endophyticus]GGH80603.1 hypothetical protein GCM10007362_29170 [Saccharibacillus endophyticus]
MRDDVYANGDPSGEDGENQVPSIRRVPFVLMWICAAAAWSGITAAFYLGTRELWTLVVLTLIGTAFFVFLTISLRKSAFFFLHMHKEKEGKAYMPHENFVLHRQLLDIRIADPRVREALVSLDGWAVRNHNRPGRTYGSGANLVLRLDDEQDGIVYVKTFPFRKREDESLLGEILLRLHASGKPVYATRLNLSELRAEDFAEAYDSLPKSLYDSRRPFELGKRVPANEYAFPYRTPRMLERKERNRRRNDARFFRPLHAAALTVNFLLALLWIPSWTPDRGEAGFAWRDDWSSGSLALQIFNLTIFIVAGRYWRGTNTLKQLWRPLRDAAWIFILHTAGLVTAGLYTQGVWERWQPLARLDLWLGAGLLVVFGLARIMTAHDRRLAALDSVDAEGERLDTREPEKKETAVDRVLQILFASVLVMNFLVAWLLPHWKHDAASGGYEGLGIYMLLSAVLLPVAGAYWRKESKWQVPIYGALSVFFAQFAGAMLGLPQEKLWAEAAEALFTHMLVLLILLYPLFAVLKGITFLLGKRKT